MKSYLLFILLIVSSFHISGQSDVKYCGHKLDASLQFDVNSIAVDSEQDCELGMTSIPVALIFTMKSDSTSSYIEGMENSIMDSITSHFLSSGIDLYLVEDPIFIYEDLVFDYIIGNNVELLYPGLKADRINIVITNSITYESGATLCGVARTIPKTVINRYSCIPSNVISHELGHELALAHTHDTQYGVELVDGSNCQTAGDRICDTPADPNRPDLDNSDCTWRGTYEDENGYPIPLLDANGDEYETDVTNLMSYYSANSCRSNFTYQQSLAMHKEIEQVISLYGYETEKMEFEVYDQEEICGIGYSASARVVNIDSDVTYKWDMNSDGLIDHSGTEIQHLYSELGNYTVKLIMSYPDGRQYYQSKLCLINYTNESILAPFIEDYNEPQVADYITLIEESFYKWNLSLHLTNERIVASDQMHFNENSIMEYKVDISSMINPVLSFEYDCNEITEIGGDSLLIELLSCDNEPIELFEKWGKELGTNGEYIDVSIPLPSVDSDLIQIRFTSKGAAQSYHDIYIDNFQITESSSTSTQELDLGSFEIFPNPSAGLVQIRSKFVISKVELYNVLGNLLGVYENGNTIDISKQPSGMFFMKIYRGSSWSLKKILKTD